MRELREYALEVPRFGGIKDLSATGQPSRGIRRARRFLMMMTFACRPAGGEGRHGN
jgi:hypothetical protein